MKRHLLLLLLLLLPSLGIASGITAVDAYLSVMPPTRQQLLSSLGGALTLRNDTGVDLKNAAVTIHILDTDGNRVTGIPSIAIPFWKAGKSETLRIYSQKYQGEVTVFKLGADISAETPHGPQTFSIPPYDPPPPPKKTNTSPAGY